MDFQKRIQYAKTCGVFGLEGYYVWCGSVARAPDGRYHLFASRWPKSTGFSGWITDSSIVRAVSNAPEGPFVMEEELVCLKEQPWCARMVHNPTVHCFENRYWLFYIGTWHNPETEPLIGGDMRDHPARFRQQIGVAVADTPAGPWTPLAGNPILSPRPQGYWDSTFVTNPAVFALQEGGYAMMYKSMLYSTDPSVHLLQLGIAIAPNPGGPYRRGSETPLLPYHMEDPYVWYEDGAYRMIIKDMSGNITQPGGGIMLVSNDAIHWEPDKQNPIAYTRDVLWNNGLQESYSFVDRPQLLIENGRPVCLYNAIGVEFRDAFTLSRLLL